MSNYNPSITVSSVKNEFRAFFECVRLLYNLSFNKEDKRSRVTTYKETADELLEANRISEYIHSIIVDAVNKYELLSSNKVKEMDLTTLEHLREWINISINDINSEIQDLMSK